MLEGLLDSVHVERIDLENLEMISVCVSSIRNKVSKTVDFPVFSSSNYRMSKAIREACRKCILRESMLVKF